MAWIDVLYLTKQKFHSADELERCIDTARQLDSMHGNADENDERIDVLKQYLASEHILNRKTVGRMGSAMQNNNIKSLHEEIDKFYEIVDNFNIEDNLYETYKNMFKQIIKSDGTFIKTHREVLDEDESMFEDENGNNEDDKDFKTFFDALVNLKKEDKNLESILSFFYNSNLTNINIENITDESKIKFPDIFISLKVIQTVCDVEAHKNILKAEFYNAVIREYTSDASDKKFIQNIVSKNNNYVDIPDENSYDEKIDLIQGVYPNSDIAYDRLDSILDSNRWLNTNAPDIAKEFKTRRIPNINLRNAIKHVVDYYSDNHIMNKIIDQKNESDIVEQVDDAISKLLIGTYFDSINKTYQAIEDYNNTLNEEFIINNKNLKLKLREYIKRWKDFLNSDIYKWNAGKINNACQKILDNLFKSNDYEVTPFGSSAKRPVFKKNVSILDIIKNIITAPDNDHYKSLLPYLDSFKSSSTSVIDKINVEKMFLKLIKDFLNTDYSEKYSNFTLANAFDAYYDAICNVIYNKDLNISESLVVEEFMYVYDYVINEDEDMSAYFGKLAQRIKNLVPDKDVKAYVNNYAKYADNNSQETVDASTATTTDASTRIEALDNAGNELKQKVETYNGGQKSDF